jgi:hypothetical protein
MVPFEELKQIPRKPTGTTGGAGASDRGVIVSVVWTGRHLWRSAKAIVR